MIDIVAARRAASADGTPSGTPVAPARPATGGRRGRRQPALLRIGGRLDLRIRVVLAGSGVALLLAAWFIGAAVIDNPSVFPTPLAMTGAMGHLLTDGTLGRALQASGYRILVGYGLSVAIGVVVGLAMGTFPSVEAFLEAQIGFLRYIPASALVPVFLLWFGLGETPKVVLILLGTVFFNILMIADVGRSVPRELVNAAYTLGAGRWIVVRRVIARWSLPGIIDAARVNLAAAWLMLVVSEILAADNGLAVGIIRAQRFRAVDASFAFLFTFGVIGLVSDLALRGLRNRTSPWARA